METNLKFYWNGIKDNGSKLQKAHYSMAKLINFPEGTITIYARTYEDFSTGIHTAFTVENNSDILTDYMEKDRIRVLPSHPMYSKVLDAYKADQAHSAKLAAKKAA